MALQPISSRFRRLKVLARSGLRLAGRTLLAYRDLFFPPFCRSCGETLLEEVAGESVEILEPRVFCRGCAAEVLWIGRGCPRCGMAVLKPGDACAECRGRRLVFDGAVAAALYEGPWRRAILIQKYEGDRELLGYLGAELARVWRDRLCGLLPPATTKPSSAPVIVPVPSHALKVFLRGRNPLQELAVELARRTGLEVRRVLRRSRYVRSQTALPRELRLRNQKRAFRIASRVEVPETVILLDDVATTMATAVDAARALRAGGARRVYVLALGRSPSTPSKL